jgi:hypothetical protein
LNLLTEALQRTAAGLWASARRAARGARWGVSYWTHTFGSLLRSRLGPWVLLIEVLLLDMAMVALWWTWHGLPLDPLALLLGFFQVLPLALVAVYLLPALAFVGAGAMSEVVKAVIGKHQ